jgi:hypothetical protein
MTGKKWEALLYQELENSKILPEEFDVQMMGSDYQHGHPPSSIKPETLVLARLLSNLVALENAFAKFISPLITCHLLRLWQCFGSELQGFFSEGT